MFLAYRFKFISLMDFPFASILFVMLQDQSHHYKICVSKNEEIFNKIKHSYFPYVNSICVSKTSTNVINCIF